MFVSVVKFVVKIRLRNDTNTDYPNGMLDFILESPFKLPRPTIMNDSNVKTNFFSQNDSTCQAQHLINDKQNDLWATRYKILY